MKRLISIATFLFCLTGLLLLMSGCGSSNAGGDSNIGVKDTVAAKVNSFKTGVEAYNVNGMLAFLDENNFEGLFIVEGDSSPQEKDYATLKGELEDDEGKQLNWREPVPDGIGYVLTMELGTIVYSNLTTSGAIASVGFTIKEKADGVPEEVTDTGTMVCEMVNMQGEWLCRRLTINFDVINGGSILSQAGWQGVTVSKQKNGFGFASFNLEN